MVGGFKQKWADLTDDDLKHVDGGALDQHSHPWNVAALKANESGECVLGRSPDVYTSTSKQLRLRSGLVVDPLARQSRTETGDRL